MKGSTKLIIGIIVVLLVVFAYSQYQRSKRSLNIGPAEINSNGEVPIGEDGIYQYQGSNAIKE
jgi:hypothetical protein